METTHPAGNPKEGIEADEEARNIWLQYLPPERVLPFAAKDNFWEMGETGPCGPCSEIHYDRIGGRDAASLVNMDDPTVIEIWNLVFIQFNREPSGSLIQLPSQHVDTGMGFERVVSILQEKMSNYDSDIFTPLFEKIRQQTSCRPYQGKLGEEDKDGVDMAYRVVADHARTLTFAIADGAFPSNDGRGYVLRRILRRGVRYGRQFLGGELGLISSIVPTVVELYKDFFPEVEKHQTTAQEVIADEEKAFGTTLQRGIERFTKSLESAKQKGLTKIPGDEAFFLYDTMGFPLDLTQLMAEEHSMGVDVDGYTKAMEKAKMVSRSDRKSRASTGGKVLVLEAEQTDHLQKQGVKPTVDDWKYSWNHEPSASVMAIYTGDAFVQSTEEVATDESIIVILDKTSFYAKSGGQVADTGSLVSLDVKFDVADCLSFGGYIAHIGRALEGVVTVNQPVNCAVDYSRRAKIAPNHTITHTLNLALREVLGEGADQKGSQVDEDKLRFDFAHGKPLSASQSKRIESLVKQSIKDSLEVYTQVITLAEAKAIHGIRAVFGEVYPDPVRVVSIGKDVPSLLQDPENEAWMALSVELCGGTHLKNTSEAGDFALVEETASAKGIRRVIGLTGEAALEAHKAAETLKQSLADAAKQPDVELEPLVAKIAASIDAATISVAEKDAMRKELNKLGDRARKAVKEAAANALAKATAEGVQLAESYAKDGKAYVVAELALGADAKVASKVVTTMAEKMNGGSAMVVSHDARKGKVLAVASCGKSHQPGQLAANAWVSAAVQPISGKGGGKPALAQAQGSGDPSAAAAVAQTAREYAEKALSI
uniref:Alanine--tRNA ligase n=1 Tax=Rhodosorus marinus TaxID=101924 RepID=A0A7S3E7W0_9RHOD|mmetsp:Transcript_15882/g.64932  ORF Transcript_15882/g.64932 Transcript_15882/m.64932 type:complete len:826 (+) Transcript_15882:767-3244(+)